MSRRRIERKVAMKKTTRNAGGYVSSPTSYKNSEPPNGSYFGCVGLGLLKVSEKGIVC